MNDRKAVPTIMEEPVAYEGFKLYDVIVAKSENRGTDASIIHEEKVAVPDRKILKKYIEKLAKEKVPESDEKWRWNKDVYKQKGKDSHYATYEELDIDPVNVVMTRIL